jgi:hypothetical protein
MTAYFEAKGQSVATHKVLVKLVRSTGDEPLRALLLSALQLLEACFSEWGVKPPRANLKLRSSLEPLAKQGLAEVCELRLDMLHEVFTEVLRQPLVTSTIMKRRVRTFERLSVKLLALFETAREAQLLADLGQASSVSLPQSYRPETSAVLRQRSVTAKSHVTKV